MITWSYAAQFGQFQFTDKQLIVRSRIAEEIQNRGVSVLFLQNLRYMHVYSVKLYIVQIRNLVENIVIGIKIVATQSSTYNENQNVIKVSQHIKKKG